MHKKENECQNTALHLLPLTQALEDTGCQASNCCLEFLAQFLFSQQPFTFLFTPAALLSLPAALEKCS